MKAADIELLASVSRPTLHPALDHAVVAIQHPSLRADANVGQLWTVPLDGSGPRRLTRGFRDGAPRFSPDGSMLAFLRAGEGARTQLAVMPAEGGEPRIVTDAPLGVDSFAWTPDSASLVFVARVPEPGRYGTVEGLEAAAEPPRRITTLRYRANGIGYTIDRRAQAFVVAVPDPRAEPAYARAAGEPAGEEPEPAVPAARQLTHADADVRSLAVSPDGARLAFVSAAHETADTDLRADAWTLRLDDPEAPPRNLTGALARLSVADLAWAGDGRLFLVAQDLGPDARDFVAVGAALYLWERDRLRRLTDPTTTDLAETTLTVLDRDAALVQDRTRGTVQLLRVDTTGDAAPLTTGPLEVTGTDARDGIVVLSLTAPDTAGDVAVLREGALRMLTDFSAPLRASGLVLPRDLVVDARDGHPVHGWVALPSGEGPHPVILMIHGGPFAQYSAGVFDEVQVLAAAGYGVVFCNPRGSAGYGHEHGRAIRQAMGTVDLDDVLDFLDGALATHPRLDGRRVGIMGGSYGGYLTAWTIAHEHRFAAAIVERGFLDPELFAGTSDIGSYFGQEYVGTDPERIAAQSPQAVADRVRTPTLIIHSSEDLRCPISQAERYFLALKRSGVETELLVFPGENHELTRSGRPRHRVQRFDAVLAWWARHLPIASGAG